MFFVGQRISMKRQLGYADAIAAPNALYAVAG
jgi:hypothetical protein